MAFEFATFLPSMGSILYLAFAVLFIKELIGLISSIGGSGSGKTVADKVVNAWDAISKKTAEWKANQAEKQQKRSEEAAKEKAASEAAGRYKANMDIKSQQASQVLVEGTQRLQEFTQNPEKPDYETYSKDLTDKISIKMDGASQVFLTAKTNAFNVITNEYNLLKQFNNSVLANKKNTQDIINNTNATILSVQKNEQNAKSKLPGVIKNIPIIEQKIKDLENNLAAEGKKPKPDKRKIAGWTKSLNSNRSKLNQLKQDESAFNKILNESQATIKLYQDALVVLNQKIVALDELLNNFKSVQLPDEQHLKMLERNILTQAQNLRKEVGELHKSFESLSKINLSKPKNAQDVGTYKQRIEDSLYHVALILQKLQELEQDEMQLSKTVLQEGRQFQDTLININKQTENLLTSINFWNFTSTNVPKP